MAIYTKSIYPSDLCSLPCIARVSSRTRIFGVYHHICWCIFPYMLDLVQSIDTWSLLDRHLVYMRQTLGLYWIDRPLDSLSTLGQSIVYRHLDSLSTFGLYWIDIWIVYVVCIGQTLEQSLDTGIVYSLSTFGQSLDTWSILDGHFDCLYGLYWIDTWIVYISPYILDLVYITIYVGFGVYTKSDIYGDIHQIQDTWQYTPNTTYVVKCCHISWIWCISPYMLDVGYIAIYTYTRACTYTQAHLTYTPTAHTCTRTQRHAYNTCLENCVAHSQKCTHTHTHKGVRVVTVPLDRVRSIGFQVDFSGCPASTFRVIQVLSILIAHSRKCTHTHTSARTRTHTYVQT